MIIFISDKVSINTTFVESVTCRNENEIIITMDSGLVISQIYEDEKCRNKIFKKIKD